jgi:hypothetical protein
VEIERMGRDGRLRRRLGSGPAVTLAGAKALDRDKADGVHLELFAYLGAEEASNTLILTDVDRGSRLGLHC